MTTTQDTNPLRGFTKICDNAHLYLPLDSKAQHNDEDSPGMIILCGWTFAQPRHIAKYIAGYQKLYSSSRILLLQVDTNNLLFRPDAWQMPMLFNRAARVVKEYVDSVERHPRILVQTYSNGGAHSIVQLAEAYHALYSVNLPVSALIMDSGPGVPRWNETVRALQSGLPKSLVAQSLGALAISGMLVVTGVMHYSGFGELAGSKLYRTLNDPVKGGAFTDKTTPRTYIHSEDDVMILSRDIEAHADIFRKTMGVEKGASSEMIRVEAFTGTTHVNHMKSDPERYWQIVEATWKSAAN